MVICSRLFSLMVLALLLGCGDIGTLPNDTLVYGRGGDSNALDPIHTDIGESVKVIDNLFEGLVCYGPENLDIVPSLATEWSTSEDGLQWTFQLREGVKFHDGTPLNADAVVFSIERIIDPDHPHVHSQVIPYYGSYTSIDQVEAVDEMTVRFTLKEPQATFLANLAMFPASIVSPTAVQETEGNFTRNPVGTGPFQLESWKPDQEIVLNRFEAYWGKPAGVSRVVFVPTAESSVRVTQLNRGEIQIADNLPPAELEVLKGKPGIEILSTPGMNVGYITMQTEKPPLNIPEVRHAICHGIDRQRLIETAYTGEAELGTTMLPPTLWGHNDSLQHREFDIEKARQLLEQAAKEHDLELPITLELFVMDSPRPYMQQPRQTGIFIKDSLEKIGFNIKIITNDIGQHFQRMTRGEHQLGLSGWSADIADPDNFLNTLMHSNNINDRGGNNLSRYRNPKSDQLLDQALVELDQEKRAELYRQAQKLMHEDAPVLPLVHVPVRVAVRKEVEGYKLHPASVIRLQWTQLAEQ